MDNQSKSFNNENAKIKRKKHDDQENQSQYKVLNIDNIDASTFKTKKKSFVSEINPHQIRRTIQKEQYIWIAVYDDLLRKKCIIKALKKCRDSSLPIVNKFF